MDAVLFILLVSFLSVFCVAGVIEVWGFIKQVHYAKANQRIQARRMANKMPKEKERVDYWVS